MPPPDGRTATQSQGVRSREEILDAAERLRGTPGYPATSISALAAASGLPPSSIYWHFGSKAGLLTAVMERGAQRMFLPVAPGPDDALCSPLERLRRLFAAAGASIREHELYLRLFVLLLLGVEGGAPQQHVTSRVRRDGREMLGHAIAWAYQPWGEETALTVSRRLGDLALVMLDGIFLAAESTGSVPAHLLEEAALAVHAQAELLRAEG